MSIVLSPEVERQIEELVRSGRFESADDCIRKSVQLMREQESSLKQRREELNRLIEEGVRDLQEGRFISCDDAGLRELFERIKREGREKMGLPADTQ